MYRCYNHNCPHFCTPCEYTDMEFEYSWRNRSTACLIGEPDYFFDKYDPDNEFILLVVGSRTFKDYELMKQQLDYFLQIKVAQHKEIIILSGGANGADSLAEKYAAEKGYKMLVMRANWDELGKKAGYSRNVQMHKFLSTHSDRGCVAFWDGQSKGTAHNFDLAKQYHTPLKIVNFA